MKDPFGIRSGRPSIDVARDIVLRKLAPKIERVAIGVAEMISGPLTKTQDQFYHDLASVMGMEDDLATRFPDITGLGPWKPLSLEYIRRKHSAEFWIYTLAAGRSRSAPFGKPLIPTLAILKAREAFGVPRINVYDFTDRLIARVGAGEERAQRVAGQSVPAAIKQLQYTVGVKFWGDITRGDVPNLEAVLTQRGVIDDLTARKLLNRRGGKRPLLGPFIARYCDVVLPAVVEKVVQQRHPGVKVKIVKPWMGGPY